VENREKALNTQNYRMILRNWLTEHRFDLAATYTFTKDIDLETADKLMKHYGNSIDRDLYGNAAWRYGKRVQRVNFAETGVRIQKKALLLQQTDGRLHIHSALMMPTDRFTELSKFGDYLNNQWLNDSKLSGNAKFVNIYSDNWLHYITKQIAPTECDTFLVNSSFIAQTDTF